MGTIELGGGAGTPPVGSSPSIVLPTVTPAAGELIAVDNVVCVGEPIPLPAQVPTDGIILLESPSVPDYSGVNLLIDLLDVDKLELRDKIPIKRCSRLKPLEGFHILKGFSILFLNQLARLGT